MSDPVGEDGWLALVDEASRTAGDIQQRVGVVELYKRAITAEPWSNKLWLAYCEWVWSLYTDCQNGDAGWLEEEQLLGQELFTLETALDVWKQGALATKYRLNDSQELWNRWMSIELEKLTESPTPQDIDRVRKIFLDRLQTPHATWDDTSQMFLTFITKHDEASWEAAMVEVTKISQAAKDQYNHRAMHELRLQKAVESGDSEAARSQMLDYLSWEQSRLLKQSKKGIVKNSVIFCVALFERALSSTILGTDPTVWEDYIVFLLGIKHEQPDVQLPSVLSVVQRATNHCPWSGKLWARYILCAEAEKLEFSTLEQIKHAATNTRDLDRDGMNDVVEFYIAWCGYLKRRTMIPGATDEDLDIAEMGLPTALEDVQQWGKRRYGEDWKGDPFFRIEMILIQHLTQKRYFEEARGYWRRLIAAHADSYEFWQQYYNWEMMVRTSNSPPTLATAVLIQAVNRKTLDWPEKMLEVYIRHCNNYEEVGALLKALNAVHRISKGVAKMREREAAQAQALSEVSETPIDPDSSSGISKRKRDDASEDTEGASKKKYKITDQYVPREQQIKRDRENTTILVSNLPIEATQTKIKQYFKDYAHINAIYTKIETDKLSMTALIELRSREDVQSSLLRDKKYFGDRQIQVVPGTGLTLFVTNYPPTADETYFHNLFKNCGEIFSIRWPSLKYKTTRRFCYISFRTVEAAAAAVELNSTFLDGKYKLIVAYSDPSSKKGREGATAEGREIHITNLDPSLTEQDVKEVLSKYGNVERVNILKKLSGESKGAGFVTFETKEQAIAALELNMTKLKSSILVVEISKERNFKPTATMTGTISSTSPASNLDGDTAMLPSSAPDDYTPNSHALPHAPSQIELTNRTITLMNIPDTVNDSRIRVIAEPFGNIVKLTLRPDHQGAMIEYADAASAGKAALGLESYEILPGHKIRTGGMKDLLADRDKPKIDKMQTGQAKKPQLYIMQPAAPIRRPGPGGWGGLGQKRGLGYSKTPAVTAGRSASSAVASGSGSDERTKPKSNADFKAMFAAESIGK